MLLWDVAREYVRIKSTDCLQGLPRPQMWPVNTCESNPGKPVYSFKVENDVAREYVRIKSS